MIRFLYRSTSAIFFGIFALFLFPQVGHAAIPTVVDSTYQSDGTTDYVEVPFSQSGSDLTYVVFAHYRSEFDQLSYVDVDSSSMTFGCMDRTLEYTTEVWYATGLYDPSTVTLSWSSTVDDIVTGVVAISGVDSGSPVDETICNREDNFQTTHSIDVNSTSDSLVLAGATVYSGDFNSVSTTSPSTTQLYNPSIGNVNVSAGWRPGQSGATTISWEGTASWPWSAAGISLAGTGGGGAPSLVVHEGSTSSSTGTGSFSNLAFPTLSGSDTVLVAVAHYRSTTDWLSSVTTTSARAFTFGCRIRNNEYTTEIWYLKSPLVGDGQTFFTWSGSVEDRVVGSMLYSNVDQTTTVRGSNCSGNGGSPWTTSHTLSISSADGDMVAAGATAFSGSGNTLTPASPAASSYGTVVGNVSVSGAYTPGASTALLSWNGTESWPISAAALSLIPASPPAPGPTFVWTDPPTSVEEPWFFFGGTVNDSTYPITSVLAELCSTAGCGTYSDTANAVPTDGSFNSTSEDFTFSFFDAPPDTYTITVQAQNSNSETSEAIFNTEVLLDDSPPEIEFTSGEDLSLISYRPRSFTVGGNASDGQTTIASVVTTVTHPDTSETIVNATAVDGAFDGELNEFFTLTFTDLPTGSTQFSTVVTNSHGVTHTYMATVTIVDDTTAPTLSMGNLGQTPSTNTTPTFSGTALDATAVASVEYAVFNLTTNLYEVATTSATAVDGTFDEPEEAFTFTTPALTDGAKLIRLKIVDVLDNTFSEVVDRIIIDAVDTTAPTILLQEVIPDPITDPTPKIQGRVFDNENELTSNIAELYFRVDAGPWQTLPVADGVIGDETSEDFSITLTTLAVGAHTVTVRAVDAAGNDTNVEGTNVTRSFTVVEQTPGLTPSEINTTISFDSRTYFDSMNSNLIWGNGQLRLAEVADPVGEQVVDNTNNRFGSRYGTASGVFDVKPSAAGGYWFTVGANQLVYVDSSDTIHEFDLTTYAAPVANGEVEEVVSDSGEYHVWVAGGSFLIGLNFGTSITDGVESYVTYAGTNINLLEIDTRPSTGEGYGIYWKETGRLRYTADISFPNTQIVDFSSVTTRNASPLATWASDITAMYLDTGRNHLWLGDYNRGVQRLSDQGVPTNPAGDERLNYGSEPYVFSIGVDQDGRPFFAGNNGLRMVIDDNGTDTNSADDTLLNLLDEYDLSLDVGAHVQYFAGDSVVPDQFYISDRSGTVYYLSTNGTYTDTLDDQLLRFNLSGTQYPAEIRRFYMPDTNTILASIVGMGGYRFDLQKQFAEEGFSQTLTDSQIDEYLDADYVQLAYANRTDATAAQVRYEVSNDGGLNWYEVGVGQTVDFPSSDYRVSLRITMYRGSTPVLTGVGLTYAAYPTQGDDERTFSALQVTGTPASVTSGQGFSFTTRSLDDLGNLLKQDRTVSLALRRSSDNQVISSFSVSSANLVDGVAAISGATANVVGDHYVQASSGSITANSSAITFLAAASSGGGSNNDGNSSSSSSDSNSSSSNGTTTTGSTATTTTPAPTTTTRSGGAAQEDEEAEVQSEGEKPEIVRFTVDETILADGKKKVVVNWEVRNARQVEISGIGTTLALSGSKELTIDASTSFQIVARNEYGYAFSSKRVEVVQLNTGVPLLASLQLFAARFPASVLQLPSIGLAAAAALKTISVGMLIMTAFAQASLAALNWRSLVNALQSSGILPFRKRKGFVHETKSGKPVAFATILVFDAARSAAESTAQSAAPLMTLVTDMYGAYIEPFLPKGKYSFEATHQQYLFPTKERRPSHLSSRDFYRGEVLSVATNKDHQAVIVPLDPKLSVMTLHLRYRLMLGINRVLHMLQWTLYPLFVLSLFAAIRSLNPFSIMIALVYLFLMALHLRGLLRRPNVVGHVSVAGQSFGAAAQLRQTVTVLISNTDGLSVAMSRCDEDGKFSFHLPAGTYALTVVAPQLLWKDSKMGTQYQLTVGSRPAKPLKLTMEKVEWEW